MGKGNSIPSCGYVRIVMCDKYGQLSSSPLRESAPTHIDMMDTEASLQHEVVGHTAWSPGKLERAHARDLGRSGSISLKLTSL